MIRERTVAPEEMVRWWSCAPYITSVHSGAPQLDESETKRKAFRKGNITFLERKRAIPFRELDYIQLNFPFNKKF